MFLVEVVGFREDFGFREGQLRVGGLGGLIGIPWYLAANLILLLTLF